MRCACASRPMWRRLRSGRRTRSFGRGNVQSAAVPGAPAVTRGVESMMCPHMEATLNEYVDGTLSVLQREAVDEHLAQCAGCRDAVAELRRLVAGARHLPPSIVPPRD